MITYSKLGHPSRGRLGNQLFQIASTIGISKHLNQEVGFPPWSYEKFFKKPLPRVPPNTSFTEVPENSFSFDWTGFSQGGNLSVDGWRQSEHYFIEYDLEVKEQFEFSPEFVVRTRAMFSEALKRPLIGVSVRRGDFVGNKNYDQIPVRFYVMGLIELLKRFPGYNVVFFSDDLHYCRVHFEGVPNVYFANGSDVEQLYLGSQCRHFVISNSTFSWWLAWLSETNKSQVIRPPLNFAGDLAQINSERDYWPEGWKTLDYRTQKIDLSDVTFTIPVFIDHIHRSQNLKLTVDILKENFDCQIIIGEQGGNRALHFEADYMNFKDKNFHRTKFLNQMAKAAKTPIVVNWDCDVFVPPFQIWAAAERIRAGADMVYPFDGRFARVPRTWYNKLNEFKDVGIFGSTKFRGKNGKELPKTSVGGAIMFNRESFLKGGGENEFMISFGPEDWERNFRFKRLGYQVERVKGSLYHLDHHIGVNSSTWNPFFKANHLELDRMRELTDDELERYVAAWPWRV